MVHMSFPPSSGQTCEGCPGHRKGQAHERSWRESELVSYSVIFSARRNKQVSAKQEERAVGTVAVLLLLFL